MGGRIEDLQKNVNDLMAQAGIDSPAQKHRWGLIRALMFTCHMSSAFLMNLYPVFVH